MLEAALYLASATIFGATGATLYWRSKLGGSADTINRLVRENEALANNVKHWRSEANINAALAASLRSKVPQRDPLTRKFVKRNPNQVCA